MILSGIEIPDDKDVIIIHMPRSGSHWVQSCFPQYNCLEPFNIRHYELDGTTFKMRDAPLVRYDQSIPNEDSEFANRFAALDGIAIPKTVKIPYQYLNQSVAEWVNEQDATVLRIERKDKVSALKSICIAHQLYKFVGDYEVSTVEITMREIAMCMAYKIIYGVPETLSIINNVSPILYYEDLLQEPLISFNPVTIDQRSAGVEITNWDYVVEVLRKNNLHL